MRRHTVNEILEIKRQVRERDGMRCTQCGITNEAHLAQHGRSLDVHRVKPGSLYSMEGCITVCVSCHGKQSIRKPAPGERDLELEGRKASISVRLSDQCREFLAQLAAHHGLTETGLMEMIVRRVAREDLPPDPAPTPEPTPAPKPKRKPRKGT